MNITPDHEKICISCKIKESNNYLPIIETQYNDLCSHFNKLTTPSRNEAFKFFQYLENFQKIEDIKNIEIPKFNLSFENFLCQNIAKGYLIAPRKCSICKYALFKLNEDYRCLKCFFNVKIQIQENFSKNLTNFVSNVSNSEYYVKKKQIFLECLYH